MSNIPEDVMNYMLTFSELSLSQRQIATEVEPDSVLDPTLSIYSRSTESPVQTHDMARPAIEIIRLQLIFRSRKYSEAEKLAYQVYDLLWDYTAPYPYDSIRPMGQPTSLGAPDQNARWSIGFAIRAQRTGGISWL